MFWLACDAVVVVVEVLEAEDGRGKAAGGRSIAGGRDLGEEGAP